MPILKMRIIFLIHFRPDLPRLILIFRGNPTDIPFVAYRELNTPKTALGASFAYCILRNETKRNE